MKYESQLAFKGKYKSWNMEMGNSFANIRFHLVPLLAYPFALYLSLLLHVIKKFSFIHTSIFMRKHSERDAMCAWCMCCVESAPIPFDEYQIFKSNKLNSDKYFYFLQLFVEKELKSSFHFSSFEILIVSVAVVVNMNYYACDGYNVQTIIFTTEWLFQQSVKQLISKIYNRPQNACGSSNSWNFPSHSFLFIDWNKKLRWLYNFAHLFITFLALFSLVHSA